MRTPNRSRLALFASAAVLALAGCGDTDIASPGTPSAPASPPPPPPPPPPPAAATTIDIVPAAGCPAGTTATEFEEEAFAGETLASLTACAMGGDITADMTITADTPIALDGPTFVTDGVTLTIEPGAMLFGQDAGSFLVVNAGGTIDAAGTVDDPIIMTARQEINDAELGTSFVDAELRGAWGGLVLNGFAPINACSDPAAEGGTAACTADGEGATGTYGGDQPADSSGTLQFLQVRYAGQLITDTNELNGIAFQGVGSGTTVNNVQVFNNSDDGVEFFGGTVNASFLALNGNGDDSLDWTDGWVGNLQFVLIDHAPDQGDNGIEADNNGDDNLALPRSNPTISNITILGEAGGSNDIGMLIREGTAATIVNGVIAGGFDEGGLDIDQTETFERIGATDAAGDEALVIESFLIDADPAFILDDGDPVDISEVFDADVNVVTDTATLQATFFPGPAEIGVPVFDATTLGAFFEDAVSVGAFRDGIDTPESNWATGWTFALLPEVELECPAGTTEASAADTGDIDGLVCDVPATILSDTTLTPGPFYRLAGPTVIGADAGPDPAAPVPGAAAVSLTIEAGTTLFGEDSVGSFLSVARGSQLFSNGTETNPVIMTARADIEGTVGADDSNLWGGLVLNGRAPINACSDPAADGGSVDCEASGEGASGVYGGATPDDDSGNLFFTQVRYAGDLITDENELNGIAFQGVGSGTTVEGIQVHNNSDDGIEFFGGTVNVSRVLLTGNEDDSIDWTDGWVGSLQFGIVQHRATVGDQGIEADNNGDDNFATPVSSPTLSNVTIIGQGASDTGALIREGTGITWVNSIVVGFDDETGLDIDQSATIDNLQGTGLAPFTIQSLFLDNPAGNILEEATDTNSSGALVDISDALDLATNNIVDAAPGSADLEGTSFVIGAPGVVPAAGGTIASVPAVDPTTVGLAAGSFLGAVSGADDDAFEGWTFNQVDAFPPAATAAGADD